MSRLQIAHTPTLISITVEKISQIKYWVRRPSITEIIQRTAWNQRNELTLPEEFTIYGTVREKYKDKYQHEIREGNSP